MTYSTLARRLDKLADKNGVDPAHLRGLPHLLEPLGLEPADLDKSVIEEARACGREALRAICDKHDIWHSMRDPAQLGRP